MLFKTVSKKTNYIFNLAVLYPLVNIALSFFVNNEGLMTLYFCASILIITYMFNRGRSGFSIKQNILIYCILLAIVLVWVWTMDHDMYSITQSIVFALGMLVWIAISKQDLSEICLEWIKKREAYINAVRCVYYSVIFASVIRGDGIIHHWGTTTLSGPYLASHLLAYELLIWSMMDAIFIVQKKRNVYLFLLVFDSAMMVLTAARSVLIPLVIIMWYVLKTYRSQKRIVITVIAIVLALILLQYTNIFEAFFEKTQRAIDTSTITSGRGMIFKSSFNAFLEASPIQKILGMGINGLTDYNLHHIWMDIHAHNDYLDALVQYGIVGLGLYIYAFYKLIRNSKSKIAMIMIVSLAFFNGFYVSSSAMIATVLFLAFDKAIFYKRKDRQLVKPLFSSATVRRRRKRIIELQK